MSILDRARQLRTKVESMAETLDDTEAIKVIELFPVWKSDFSYQTGKRVRYNDILYKCLVSHTSQDTWNPVNAASLWAKILIPDSEVIPEWEQPESTNPYMKGDKVKHLDRTWISDIDNNVWEPGVYGWSEVI